MSVRVRVYMCEGPTFPNKLGFTHTREATVQVF